MHPNEVELAKNDLTNFINLKTLSGSVTRCRFRSLKNHLYVHDNKKGKLPIKENEAIWHILDLVIYTATDETDAQRLIGQLKKNTDRQENRTAKIPFSVFQVKDQASQHELFSWPQFNQASLPLLQAVESITKSMPLVEFKSCSSVNSDLPVDSHTKVHLSSSGDITCTRHFYASKKMDFENKACYFERIVIPYGSVVFEAFQIRHQTNYQLHYSYTSSFIPNNTQRELEIHPLLPQFSSQPDQDQDKKSSSSTSPPLFQKFRIQQIEKPTQMTEKRRKMFETQTLQSSMSRIADMVPNKYNKTSETINVVKVCARCRTNNSPEWRRGPDGNKTKVCAMLVV
ncbi:hypothetical protein G6F57_006316 [Rhizopus arrhizus]|uniref:GATA-type domain-containing protein n=1 Tax=Rhizopus oryzae TaxID=64495 RepID=A0A9P6XKH9_RHIOR|nr:hypothetical protein G6F23_005732 [Rhizopus arrhizus]KAG1411980.1 hypothetical protein G6F58_008267 [Rhizopus delemar]KAG0758258.1 hypothetical protein G6F24_009919 [Rhizopus arrhizus]KAG0790570.1 hypothetical protein G6F21_005716 [Rhizopus arrhizus]KAG0793450.1 hypothetical protein G6F22_005604 [Rhizopus arrhizus]